jgi:hypothetical protein
MEVLGAAAGLGAAAPDVGRKPEAWLFRIRGYKFGELVEGSTDRARDNLRRAIEFVEPRFRPRASHGG